MRNVLHLQMTVLLGGRIEIVDQGLSPGETVDVIVLPATSPTDGQQSVTEVFAEALGLRLFKTAADVEALGISP